MERFQQQSILRDLEKKMVILSGPRQAGKTTLAKAVSKQFSSSMYLNYDSAVDRKILLKESWLPSVELLIFDEIHKMPKWKNYLKGIYDTKPAFQKILVAGSARLEVFKKVGDSLAGRYFLHRLMPLSPAECEKMHVPYTIDRFLERGGFLEPFLAQEVVDANRWRFQYINRLGEDVLDFENIQNVKAFRLVFDLLRERVGFPVSYSSIAQDVAVSVNTVKKYIQILEALYIVFRVTPFSRNIARSLLKEPKIYFFDTGLVKGDPGVKFENLVGVCLLKHVFAKIDYQAKMSSLHYLLTKEKKEVDFVLAEDNQMEKLIEVKHADPLVSANLRYFHEKYQTPAVQVVKELKREWVDDKIEVVRGDHFLKSLYL